MDIYCGRCTEPWDHDSLHEAADEHDSTYEAIQAAFRRVGCAAIEYGPDATATCARVDNDETTMIRTAMELSEHADDWAADLDGMLG